MTQYNETELIRKIYDVIGAEVAYHDERDYAIDDNPDPRYVLGRAFKALCDSFGCDYHTEGEE